MKGTRLVTRDTLQPIGEETCPLEFYDWSTCEYRERRNHRNRQQLIHGGAPKPSARQGNAEYKALLLDVAEKLSHIIDGEPNPRLGMLGSIKHTDHLKLWRHWFKWVATPKNRLKGVAIDPEGFPYP